MKLLQVALAAALVGGSAVVSLPDPAGAQVLDSLRNRQSRRPARNQCRLQNVAGQREFQLSPDECVALAPVLTANAANDIAGIQAALPAAAAAAQGADARYIIAQAQLRVAIAANDTALQARAIDAIIASGGASAAEMPLLLNQQIEFAIAANNLDLADQLVGRLAQANPNDPELFIRQAGIRIARNDRPGALALYQRAIQARAASGQPVPEDWRRRALAAAYTGRLGPQSVALARELVVASPTPQNWRDALAIYREFGGSDASQTLDLYRLMRAAGTLTSERDYVEYAEAANRGAVFGEVKSVLEAGLAANAITGNAGYAREMIAAASRRIAADRPDLANQRGQVTAGRDALAAVRLGDAYYGYGQYGDAVEMYRAALRIGGQDANMVNTRLGAALALAGQRAEAEAAFRAVTGPRAALASYWLLWLSTRS